MRKGDHQSGGAFHLPLDASDGPLVTRPAAAGDTVVDIPEKHLTDMAVAVFATVYHHTESTVDHFAPAYAAAIVQRHPGSTAEGIADDILYRHVGTELRTVVDVAGFSEGRVCTRHVMMVAPHHDGTA